ncbi:MAG: endolytic transglycosylase MltG [Actinomycetales bacterium]|nr:endolytic transglycosylase MltG [Actinomycetales bacterium]
MSQLQQFMTDGPLPPSANRRSPWRMIAALAAVLVLLAAVGSVFLVNRSDQAAADFAGPGSGTVEVIVARGDTLTQIGRTLKQAGVVATVDAFVSAATVSDQAASIGPGRYTLRRGMSAQEALALMLDPASRAASRLVLPEGLRMTQTISLAAEATDLPESAFKKALESPTGLGLPAWAKDRPEGLLFPASYDLAGDETAADVLSRLFERFGQASTDLNLVQRSKELGLEPSEVLTIASIVQAEGHPDDFAKVARVIYNRLEAGMPLQMDSTVAYGLGVTDLTLSQEQLASDTPYNTYVNEGLPPTPINSPGEAAMRAALEPAKGKWLYFVTVNPDTGETKFTRSYEKFLQFKQEFQDYLKSKG